MRSWDYFERTDGRGLEPYMINSPLIIANPKGRNMARTISLHRNSKGQFVARRSNPKRKHHTTNHAKKRTSVRHHKANYFPSVGAVLPFTGMNPKGKRRHKRNPPLQAAIENAFPIDTIAGVTAGIIGPPLIQGAIAGASPSTAATYPTIVKAASYAIPPAIAYAIDGAKGLRNVVVGEIAALLARTIASAINTSGIAAVSLASARGYLPPVQRTGARGLAAARGYIAQPVTRQQMGRTPSMSTRLESRFGSGKRFSR
jgi:hypothetical protein